MSLVVLRKTKSRQDADRPGFLNSGEAITQPANQSLAASMPDWLCGNDAMLPHLSKALDPHLMREVFAAALLEAGAQRYQVTDGEIVQARYKPGRNCLLTYRLKILDDVTQREVEQILCARMYESGGSYERFRKAQEQSFTQPPFGAPLFHLPALEMVIWAFPNERKLSALPVITDDEILQKKILPEVIASQFGKGWEISKFKKELIHYVAEHTCTIRVSLDLKQAATGDSQHCVLFGKTYYNEEGAETFRLMQQLGNSETCRQGKLLLAEPLAWQPEIRTLWQKGIQGASLHEYSATLTRYRLRMEQAATALAVLHQSGVKSLRIVSTRDLLTRLQQAEAIIVAVRPQLRTQFCAVAERLREQAAQLQTRPAVLLHGDLHLKNFLVTDSGVALIDLDNSSNGDPLIDLGSLLAALQYREMHDAALPASAALLIESFLAAYQQQVEWLIPRADLDWHIAYSLIAERAVRCITRLKIQQPEILEHLLAMAARRLNGGTTHG